MTLSTARKSSEVLEYLQTRRSCPMNLLGDQQGPNHEEIKKMLEIAARVPDHGRLYPWYFVVFDGDARRDVGALLREAYKIEEPDATEDKLDLEAARFLRASTVILVISRIRMAKKPVWEQILSSANACYNLSLAANAMGYGANWLTEWYSSNAAFKTSLGLDERDHIAGAIYIGNVVKEPEERPRPNVEDLTTFWQAGATLNKGAAYDPEKPCNPAKGFSFPDDFR